MLIWLCWYAGLSAPLFADPQRQVFSGQGPYYRSITVSVILKHYLNNLLSMIFKKLFELVSTVELQWMPSGLPPNSIMNSQLSAIIVVTWIRRLPGSTLKFYLFPLRDGPWKKGCTQKKIFQFSVKIFFFKFHWKLKEICPMNTVLSLKIFLANCLCNFIAYSRTIP